MLSATWYSTVSDTPFASFVTAVCDSWPVLLL